MRTLACALLSLLLATFAATSHAQFATVINIPGDPMPAFIGSNTQLNVNAGANVISAIDIGELSGSGVNTEFNVFGGFSGGTARARHGATVNLHGGFMSNLAALTGSVVNVHNGGRSSSNLDGQAGSQIRVMGGLVENGFRLRSDAMLALSGGLVSSLTADAGSSIAMSGGELTATAPGIFANVNGQMTVSGGALSRLVLSSTSQVKFKGAEFLLDGVPVAGLDNLGDTTTVNVPVGSVISGVLEDGVPFILSSHTDDALSTATLTLEKSFSPVYAPATLHASTGAVPRGLHNLQTLIVDANNKVPTRYIAGVGSKLVVNDAVNGPSSLKAVGSAIEVNGGTLGNVTAFNSSLQIADGSVASYKTFGGSIVITDGGHVGEVQLRQGATMSLVDGTIDIPNPGSLRETLEVHAGSIFNMSGGRLGFISRILQGGTANIIGGTLGSRLYVDDGATANLSGGQIGQAVNANAGGTVNFTGRSFMLDGIPVDAPPAGAPYVVGGRDKTLSGILADGTTFVLPLAGNIHPSAYLTLSWAPVPEPSTLVLSTSLVALAVGTGRRRKT